MLADEKITEIDSEDLEKIEDVLEHITESKRELGVEVDDLAALKEDITEYQEVVSAILSVLKILSVFDCFSHLIVCKQFTAGSTCNMTSSVITACDSLTVAK